MLLILSVLISLGSLACWIIVLVKAFQSGNVVLGIVCLCPLVAFIMGWVKSNEWNIQKVMLIWTVLVVASIGLNLAMPRPTFQHAP